ncbi:MAG: 2-oxo acid dehydrogenase subunit E2 [Propionibacteriaceae bacterium]|jgi:pyruvate dehydrogenase E2 component (dihydrolipoamide acetyltransferase)|nr:2-oxo acid dehydrogenase subunit E2 [Propionibacteriaceae bacterium]
MATVVVMPQAGNTVESCLITKWDIAVGDAVKDNTIMCEIETDKSSMEIPVGAQGTVLALLAEEGDEVPVKEPIAVIGEPGESVDPALLGSKGTTGEGQQGASAADAGGSAQAAGVSVAAPQRGGDPATSAQDDVVGAKMAPTGTSLASPRARNTAAAKGVDATAIVGTGPNGRVIERDVLTAAASAPGLTSAAKLAGGTVGRIGTGIGGRVTASNLASGTGAQAAAPITAASPSIDTADFPGAFEDTPLKGVRKIVAERMLESLQVSAQLSYTSTANAAGLQALRKRFKSSDPELGYTKVTIGDLVGFALVQTLKQFPGANATLADGVWRKYEHVHLAMAVDTPRGLLVPTLRYADLMNLKQFSDASKVLAQEAIGGGINPDLLSGGTFTVSNLGAFGIESFTPIVNQPQVAILGVDAITPRAVINADGTVGVQQRIGFSLTADHRVIDGADAARILQDLVKRIENIDLTVLG